MAFSWLLFTFNSRAATHYVDASGANPLSPYTNWITAATNIQDAVDASTDSDLVLVTNGVYFSGGKVMAGDLVNRVALSNAITVQSVNGPWVTTILGAGATNGTSAVRCAWLTNGASLVGFTLTGGATRTSGDAFSLESGGGIWCASTNALLANCVIVSNTAFQYGAAVYQGTILNSFITSNTNHFTIQGAAYKSVLNSCTVVSNGAYGVTLAPAMTNCIIYYNYPANIFGTGGAFSHCCTTPSLSGTGNFTNAPELFADNVHLLPNSPCVGAGVNIGLVTDIFGNTWSNPPSIGCAEWDPAPAVTSPQIQLTGDPAGFTVGRAAAAGQPPFTFWWIKDGAALEDNGHFNSTQTSNLIATGVSFADAGNYQFVVSNSFGVVTSTVAQLVVHCVDAAGANPTSPYLSWDTAATNIQDAIAAAAAGDVILVTNGIYASGGKSMDGVITNRVSLDKAVLVQSANGPNATVIQGAWDSASTNGPAAVRCAWMTNSAILSGFTLCGGATRTVTASSNQSMSGGGVFGTSNNAVVYNCILATNFASNLGGGAYSVTLDYCTLTGNHAYGSGRPGVGVAGAGSGGGAVNSNLKNCEILGNYADQSNGGGVQNCRLTNCAISGNSSYLSGGGANGGTLINCTITANTASGYSSGYGAAVYGAKLTNCIVFGNFSRTSYPNTNYASCTLAHCCADPLPSGPGNIDVDPQLLSDGIHLAKTSLCLGTGTSDVVSGTDIDGQPWNNPPPIGCDEWQPAPIVIVQPNYQIASPLHGLTFNVAAAGQAPFSYFWSKDGVPIEDNGHYSNSSTASLTVDHFGLDDAGVYQVVVTNSFGVATSALASVVIHAVDASGTEPVPPYSSWSSAATNIQDAINVASAGDIVLVTNGVYSSGGMVMAGDLTNRVVVNKAITVMSVNGYKDTIIQGVWDPVSTNGPGAVRCAWIGNGGTLIGFTLRNGATRATGDSGFGGPLESGGGVLFNPTQNSWGGIMSNCLLTNNAAICGGGIALGSLLNSLVIGNYATKYGAGAYDCYLGNCTVTLNYVTASFSYRGAGTYFSTARNSIIVGNYDLYPGLYPDDVYGGSLVYCCTPSTAGTGNINADPGFLDAFHISSLAPCRGSGSAVYTTGYDLDDEPWNNPPSMGCDEVVISNLVGPLSVSLNSSQTNLLVSSSTFPPPQHYGFFQGAITGRAAYVAWSFGDGSVITNIGVSYSHYWTNTGDYIVSFTAYNQDNPGGVTTNLVVHVMQPDTPQLLSPVFLGNEFQFQFAGQLTANYTIEYTTNLVPPITWTTLQSIDHNFNSLIQINDSSTTNQMRFYRVLAQ